MSVGTVDLYDYPFWVAFALGLLLVTPVTSPGLRKWLLAAVNLAFLAILLRRDAAAVAGVLVLTWGVLRVSPSRRWGGGLLRAGLLAVLALFLYHKLPALERALPSSHLQRALSVVGFSYVALRLVEVFRAVAERPGSAPDLASTVNYLVPFHMVAAGPIQAYDDFLTQPGVPPALGFDDALRGFERVATGLFKKFVLASAVQKLFLTGFRAPPPYFFIEVQFNYLWLYLDFSAYSDVAVGVGRLLGVATPENFNRPFLARNIVDFWERWHISLSLFIRRHLFIPTQLWLVRATGGRRPVLAASVAFTVSFLLCGLWHNVSLPWLAWGASQAVGLVACNLYKRFLITTLGRKGERAYLANPWVRCVAVFVTFEYFAFSLVLISYPFRGYFR
jgi:alginate O-acetyltransferase complex protein AlgI